MNIQKQLCQELNLKSQQVEKTLNLLAEGATVPFIARYRKEVTGNLDEIQIRNLFEKHTYYRELEERKTTILETIRSQGKLTPDLEKKIQETTNKTELEDIYLPFKPKRQTRATKAKDAGLEPLARWIHSLEEPDVDCLQKAAGFQNPEKGFDTPENSLQGACDILAEELSEDADNRKWLRQVALIKGELKTSVRKNFKESKTKFHMYYDYRENVQSIPSHRILAILRGEREKILQVKLEMPEDDILKELESRFIPFPKSAAADLLRETAKDGYQRLLSPAIETEIRKIIKEEAEEEAFRVFNQNLKELLLAPPAGQKPVLGIDPGFRTGCKIAALDRTGKFLAHKTIYPHEPQKEWDQAKLTVLEMIAEHSIHLIAIGNGTASRETELFTRQIIKKLPEKARPICVIISEAGASVYSASPAAAKEFPDFDVTVRGAISIGRRLQDPLSELVKIDPKSIGVGQYQHDVNQTKLKSSLENVVENCVNSVGVNLNLASEEILKYVSGLNQTHARNIIDYRNTHGAFESRKELKKVPGLGEKTFEQAAGFMRIPEGKNPLDNSGVHPERYGLVRKMAESINTSIPSLIGNKQLIRTIPRQDFISGDVGLPTIEDILAELEKPGRDPRSTFRYASFQENIQTLSDLEPGMELEGTVTNVTNFGAFVDIGVHQDGLVHISELSNSYVKNPNDVVKVGQIVKVKILSVDEELKRIGLSMKQ